jgi:hypothetical protein
MIGWLPLPRLWLHAGLLGAGALAGAAGGYAWRNASASAELAQAHAHHAAQSQALQGQMAAQAAAHAAQREAALAEALARWQQAQAAERAAVRTLHATQSRLADRERRLQEALDALPDDDGCGLSAARISLLNDAIADAAGAAAGAAVPAPAGGPDAAAAAAAADPRGGADQAALAGWAAAVIGLYDACRARVEAIRQWDEVVHGR